MDKEKEISDKPLTLDELKALRVSDWVWDDISKDYLCIHDKMGGYLDCIMSGRLIRLYYGNYGTEWLAYKNKEMAEGKYDEIRKQVAKDVAEILISVIREEEKDETIKIKDVHSVVRDIVNSKYDAKARQGEQ